MSRRAALIVLATIAVAAGLFAAAGRGAVRDDQREAAQEFQAQLARDVRGPDANHNGIRDDVEAWIAGRFPAASRERKAYSQLAADYQRVLLTTNDRQQSVAALRTLARSLGCFRYVLGSDATAQLAQFKAVVLDSDVRVRVWLKAYDRLADAGIDASAPPSASDCRSSR